MIRYDRIRLVLCVALAGVVATATARQGILKNGSMELGTGPGGIDERRAAGWEFFGSTVERSAEENLEPLGGGFSLKAFGGATVVGAFQDLDVLPGEMVTISAELYTRATDHVGGDAFAGIKLEFLDGSDELIGSGTELPVLDSGSPSDTWTPASIGPVAAPAGAVKTRFTCLWVFTNQSQGSAYWDNCQLTIDGGEDLLKNGDFEEAGTSQATPFGITNWIGFGTQEKSEEVALDGSSSAKIGVGGDSGSTFSGLFQDMADLEAGDRVLLNAHVFSPNAGGLSASAAAAIKLEFFPSGGAEIPPPEEALDFDENAPTDSWELVSYTTTVPDNITLARIVLLANDEIDTNGPVYFDSADAERSSQPGTNQLLNPSFEMGAGGANGLTNWVEFRGLGCSARKNAFEVPADDGLSVLKITGNCVAGIYQEIEVTPGEMLTISSFVRSRTADPFNDPLAMAGVKVEWQAGNIPGQIDIGGPTNTVTASDPADTWNNVFIDFTMPPGSAAGSRFTVIAALSNALEANVFFDSCEAVVLNKFDGADLDGDDDQDMLDFARLQTCYSGPGGGLGWPCIVYDQDDDLDVDGPDANFFYPRITGPAQP